MKVLRLNSVLGWFLSTATDFFSGINQANLNCSDRYDDSSTQIGPYSLVQLAYQGKLIKQGISKQAALIEAHRIGHINAITLVKSAVKAKLISAIALTNTTYLNAVETAFLMHYLLHPVKSSQQKNVRSIPKQMGTTEAARRIEQQYFLERRHFW